MEQEAHFTLCLGGGTGKKKKENRISEHKALFTSQNLNLGGVNVFPGTEPKRAHNYGLKDGVDLGHATLHPQQNPAGVNTTFVRTSRANCDLRAPQEIRREIRRAASSALCQGGRPRRLISSSALIQIYPRATAALSTAQL